MAGPMTEMADLVEAFGRTGGAPVVYFHGTPGAAGEAALLADAAEAAGVELLALRRRAVAPDAAGPAYLDALAATVRTLGGGAPVPILGFSIGAALALRVAARLGTAAGPLLLISAGGPLDRAGAFDGMGGGAAVFRAAQKDGRGFRMAVAAQTWLARRAPSLLRAMLFAGADPGDRALAARPEVRAMLDRVFADAWAADGRAYARDLRAYVEPWSAELGAVRAPVRLWHGAADRWAPVGMARDLATRLPSATLTELPGGHYATLLAAVPAALQIAAGAAAAGA
jgi:pimeloyl-ACP methyl ester carboxylesterase